MPLATAQITSAPAEAGHHPARRGPLCAATPAGSPWSRAPTPRARSEARSADRPSPSGAERTRRPRTAPDDGDHPDGDHTAQRPGHEAIVLPHVPEESGRRNRSIHCAVGVLEDPVAQLLILTSAVDGEVLPALGLLSHRVRSIPAEPASLINAPACRPDLGRRAPRPGQRQVAVQDPEHHGRERPAHARAHRGRAHGRHRPTGASTTCSSRSAGPAEVDARIRLVIGRQAQEKSSSKIQASGVVIDEASYSAKVHGRPLDLTFKEFELLRFFATHPSGCSRASSCSARSGATTTSAAPARSTCTCGACAPSSATWSR